MAEVMKLKRFRITNFRSFIDSGWADVDDITSIVGLNESGKTNILNALWKFNPANNVKINLTSDIPVEKFLELRNKADETIFVQCEFLIVDDNLIKKMKEYFGVKEPDKISKKIIVSRSYSGKYFVDFKDFEIEKKDFRKQINEIIEQHEKYIIGKEQLQSDDPDDIKKLESFKTILKNNKKYGLTKEWYKTFISDLRNIIPDFNQYNHYKLSEQNQFLLVVLKSIVGKLEEIWNKYSSSLTNLETINSLILNSLPKFIYYSSYGNIESQIFVNEIIDNLRDKNLSEENAAKIRTIKNLFKYVELEDEEIEELLKNNDRNSDSPKRSQSINNRNIVTRKLSDKLTKEFNKWWKNDKHNIIFRLDGSTFSVYVSDAEKNGEILLGSRSNGLQWFLSFFIVFSIESKLSLSGTILLLDEAALTLHPSVQKHFLNFLEEKLSKDNQIIYATHSPFLVNLNNLDRIKAVYVNYEGYSKISSDLSIKEIDDDNESLYSIRAALGLNVSDVFLQSCNIVVVEGISDQIYLNAIKLYLIKNNKFKNMKNILFYPAGGVHSIRSIINLLSTKNSLPKVIVDSDKAGENHKKILLDELYKGEERKILSIFEVTKKENSEIEDLFPISIFKNSFFSFQRKYKIDNFDYDKVFSDKKLVMKQFKEVAGKYFVNKAKIKMSKKVSHEIIESNYEISDEYVNSWIRLFKILNKE